MPLGAAAFVIGGCTQRIQRARAQAV
jgi:hypothetical protein